MKGLRFTGMWAGLSQRKGKEESLFFTSVFCFLISLMLPSLLLPPPPSSPSSMPRCWGLFQGSPPCLPYPEASTLPVYPEASPCPVFPVYPAASPGVCLFPGPSPWQLCLRLLGGCCRTAALCWTTSHLEVTHSTGANTGVTLQIQFVFLFFLGFFLMCVSSEHQSEGTVSIML